MRCAALRNSRARMPRPQACSVGRVEERFWLTRVPFPGKPDPLVGGDPEPYRYRELGGQWDWCWAVAMPYQALAAPTVARPMPAAPDGRGSHMDYLGYWACLQSFLTFSFGWSRHDKGLVAWLEGGMPLEDPRFALVEQVWGRDGALDRYLQWCLSNEHWRDSPLSPWLRTRDDAPATVGVGLSTRLRAAVQTHGSDSSTGVSPHGQHLEDGLHIGGPARSTEEIGAPEPRARFTIVDRKARRAVIECASVHGWYRELADRTGGLSAEAGASWRVDVYVKPIGYLGSYRRSWATGLWFAGQHRWHAIGN